MDLDPWYLENLVCPIDRSLLHQEGRLLVSENGHRYPIVYGIPVMLRDDVVPTIGVARASLEAARAEAIGERAFGAPLYVETLGITDAERSAALAMHERGTTHDPVVAAMIGATSGIAYKHLVGARDSIEAYPIPRFRFPTAGPGTLLDIGCNWGRWSIAAALAGHSPIGIDPQLGAVLAARRICAELGVHSKFVVGDARYLPFRANLFDYVWSYSVLQHFSRADAHTSLLESQRVTKSGGVARIQMANAWGARSFYHIAKRHFQEPKGFDVRYWSPAELRRVFTETIGPTRIEADCFLGLGLQWSDLSRMAFTGRVALFISEGLRKLSKLVYPLRLFADSLFCTAQIDHTSEHP